MKKVLVTGASGFVGRHIVTELLSRDCFTVVVIRSDRYFSNFEQKNFKRILTNNLFLEDKKKYFQILEGIDIVIHAAWYYDPKLYLDSYENITCLTGSLRMIDACIERKIEKFVGIGTCYEYDFTDGILNELSKINPKSLYGASKASLYFIASELMNSNGIKFSWCRPFFLYGEGENENKLHSYIHNQLKNNLPVYLTSGDQIRDYLDVKIAATKIVNVALGEHIGAVNICSGNYSTVREIALKIAEKYSRTELIRFGERNKRRIDPDVIVGSSIHDNI